MCAVGYMWQDMYGLACCKKGGLSLLDCFIMCSWSFGQITCTWGSVFSVLCLCTVVIGVQLLVNVGLDQ